MGVGALCSLSIEHLPTEVDLGCHVCGYGQECSFQGFSVQRLIRCCIVSSPLFVQSMDHYSSRLYNGMIFDSIAVGVHKPREINFTQIVCQFLLS